MKKFLVFLVIALIASSLAFGVDYPRKPVSVICPWGAGGGTDRVARYVADELSKALGQPFTVVNRTGGGGAVGHSAGVYAAPDGYTITLVTLEIANMHWLGLTTICYEDFEYIAQFNEDAAGVIVAADAPWNDIHELLADIKANPNEFFFSGSSAASIWDLARIGMFNEAGVPIDSVTWVPTTGAAPSIIELLGGHVDVITCSIAEAASQLESGQLKALAVMSDERLAKFPDVPTLKEQGINWSAGTWRGIAVPVGTPDEVKEILETEVLKIANSDAFAEFMAANGFGIKIRNGEEFYEFAKQQDSAWKEVLKLGGFIE